MDDYSIRWNLNALAIAITENPYYNLNKIFSFLDSNFTGIRVLEFLDFFAAAMICEGAEGITELKLATHIGREPDDEAAFLAAYSLIRQDFRKKHIR
jgi:hypothetical protein